MSRPIPLVYIVNNQTIYSSRTLVFLWHQNVKWGVDDFWEERGTAVETSWIFCWRMKQAWDTWRGRKEVGEWRLMNAYITERSANNGSSVCVCALHHRNSSASGKRLHPHPRWYLQLLAAMSLERAVRAKVRSCWCDSRSRAGQANSLERGDLGSVKI